MTTIACPVCAGPVELIGEKPECLIGHDFAQGELLDQLGHEASSALWSAVRALEDSASGARWRLTLPSPPPYLQESIALAEREAKLLRDLLTQREGAKSETDHRPQTW